MTRKEITEGLRLLEDNMVYFDELLNDKGKWIDVHELLFEAIKVLKQEPCEDCISRVEAQKRISIRLYESALNTVGYDCKTSDVFKDIAEKLSTCISEMPSVQPKPKMGHWEQYGYSWEDRFKCSECGKEQPKILCGERIIGHWSDYCPNCGADMRESEDT